MTRERTQFDNMTEPGFWENINKTTADFTLVKCCWIRFK